VGKRQLRFNNNFAIKSALNEAAIIWFCNVFTSGSAGDGIAGNNQSELNNFRESMKEYALKKLMWEDINVLNDFISKVKTNRNKLIAHYDATYTYSSSDDSDKPAIQQMKLPGLELNMEEMNKLCSVVQYMVEFLYD
jgi:hypothetical protein